MAGHFPIKILRSDIVLSRLIGNQTIYFGYGGYGEGDGSGDGSGGGSGYGSGGGSGGGYGGGYGFGDGR